MSDWVQGWLHVSSRQRGMESREPGRKGRRKFFIPWSPLPSRRGRNTLKSFGEAARMELESQDNWLQLTSLWGPLPRTVGSSLPVPLSSLLHFPWTPLPGFPASGWVHPPALPAIFEKRHESLRHTSFFQLLNTTPQQEELHANQIVSWIKTR